MIASLQGIVALKAPDHVIVLVNGVGYRVWVSLETLCRLPELHSEVSLHIHTHVREDAIHLYGFRSLLEKELFLRLIGISGIGPKVAMNILSRIPPEDLRGAIQRRDVSRLNAIPGVGKKTAERLVVELSEKLGRLDVLSFKPGMEASRPRILEDAVSALVNLGFRRKEVEEIVHGLAQPESESPKLEALIRQALRRLNETD